MLSGRGGGRRGDGCAHVGILDVSTRLEAAGWYAAAASKHVSANGDGSRAALLLLTLGELGVKLRRKRAAGQLAWWRARACRWQEGVGVAVAVLANRYEFILQQRAQRSRRGARLHTGPTSAATRPAASAATCTPASPATSAARDAESGRSESHRRAQWLGPLDEL